MRTTLTIDDDIYLELKHKAIDAGVSMSEYLQDALVARLFPHATTREEIERRMQEPTITHEEVVARLEAKGIL